MKRTKLCASAVAVLAIAFLAACATHRSENNQAWYAEHDAHGGPVARPEALTGTLPSAEAAALRREAGRGPNHP